MTKQYEITYKVTGFYTVRVDADSMEDAAIKGEKEICETDFGFLENIEWEDIA